MGTDIPICLLILINVLSLILQIVFFAYGLTHAIRGTLSPIRMGIVIAVFFIAMCITGSDRVLRGASWQLISLVVILIVPDVLGAAASFLYFIRAKNNKALPVLIAAASLWGIIRIAIREYEMIRYASQYVSMDTTLEALLKICIYILILYQTYVLNNKRKNAIEISEQQI